MKQYDAIVVGAGPAGSMAAYTIARAGMSALLIDRKRRPGTPKKCAEAVGANTFELAGLAIEDGWVSNEYDSLRVGFMGSSSILVKTARTRGYVLNRKKFDYDLAMRSRAEGADHLLGASVTGVSVKDGVTVSTEQGEFASKMVIAADGARSVVARQVGLGGMPCCFSLQYEVEGACDLPRTLQIFFYPDSYRDGYCWIFPKKDSINIGLGAHAAAGLKAKLDRFVDIAGFSSRKILDISAGLLPVPDRLRKICAERSLIAGDAAGHINPLTGGGIPAALYDGVLCGRVCVEAVRSGRFDERFLCRYQRAWDASPFNRAWRAGRRLKKAFNSPEYFMRLKSVFARVGPETIHGRGDLIRTLFEKKPPLRDMVLLYRFGAAVFDEIIDYAM